MHDPGHSPAESARLGALRAKSVLSEQQASPQPSVSAPPPLAPLRIAESATPHAYALREGALVLPGGLLIHNVPKSVGVRSVRAADGGDLWEVVDARGRRLALLKAEAVRSSTHAGGDLLSRTTAARSVAQRSDWDAGRVKVVTDRFLGENHVYTIERRAEGTGWIWSGLELNSTTCGGRC